MPDNDSKHPLFPPAPASPTGGTTPDVSVPGVSPETVARVAAALLQSGQFVRFPSTPDVGARLDEGHVLLKDVHAQRQPLSQIEKGVDICLGATLNMLGVTGPGEPAPKGTYSPAYTLCGAIDDLLRAKHNLPGPLYNITVPPDVPALLERTRTSEKVDELLIGHKRRLGNHQWVDRLRLHKFVTGAWKFIGPLFMSDEGLQRQYPALYKHMTERYEQGVSTRKDNEAMEEAWEAERGEALQMEVEQKVKEGVAEDLARSFVKHLEEEGGGSSPSDSSDDRRDRRRNS